MASRLAFPEENNNSLKKIAKLEDPAEYSRLGLVVSSTIYKLYSCGDYFIYQQHSSNKLYYIIYTQQPRRSDLDMNKHVNNVTYIGWALEVSDFI